jgi:hypothetical protein
MRKGARGEKPPPRRRRHSAGRGTEFLASRLSDETNWVAQIFFVLVTLVCLLTVFGSVK